MRQLDYVQQLNYVLPPSQNLDFNDCDSAFHFFRMIQRPHLPRMCEVAGIHPEAVRTAAAIVYNRYPDRKVRRQM